MGQFSNLTPYLRQCLMEIVPIALNGRGDTVILICDMSFKYRAFAYWGGPPHTVICDDHGVRALAHLGYCHLGKPESVQEITLLQPAFDFFAYSKRSRLAQRRVDLKWELDNNATFRAQVYLAILTGFLTLGLSLLGSYLLIHWNLAP